MAKRSAKARAARARGMKKPWQPLIETELLSPDYTKWDRIINAASVIDAKGRPKSEFFANNRYSVLRETVPAKDHGFDQEHDLVWLSIKPMDDSAHHDWRDFQQIKNELAGPEWEAIEIYPAESRLVDSCNQFHLWCFDPEMGRLPVGFFHRFVMEENSSEAGSQRKWENNLRPDDLTTEKEFYKKMSENLEKVAKEEEE